MAKREIWRPIPNWELLYEVSSRGRVRSLDRLVMKKGKPGSTVTPSRFSGKVLQPFVNGKGYRAVKLSQQGRQPVTKYVHQLVLTAFIGPPPLGQEVCHNDGNPWNCTLTNLRYDTRSANSKDCVRQGRCYLKNNPGIRWVKV